MRLDNVMEDEGVEEFDFDFDDPQERHFESIRGLLRANPATLGVVKGSIEACDGLAEIAAKDTKSVGTVVTVGDDRDEVVAFAAAIGLDLYPSGQVALAPTRQTLSSVLKKSSALILRGKLVNVPPRVVAGVYKCLATDLEDFGAESFVVLVCARPGLSTSQNGRSGKKQMSLDCDYFDDECFAAEADHVVALPRTRRCGGGDGDDGTIHALRLDPKSFQAAVSNIQRQAETSSE